MRFGALVGTLRDEVADLYLSRPLTFQKAHVDLNEGRLDEARAAYDQLVVADPDDAILRLERGRCRLMAGDPVGAREDLEAAWPALGDEPLDQQEKLSVPLLWAEACLEMDDAEAVIQGLTDLAGFADGTEPANPDDGRDLRPRAARGGARRGGGGVSRAVRSRDFGLQTEATCDVRRRPGPERRARPGDRGAGAARSRRAAPPASARSRLWTRLAAATLARLYLDRTPEGEPPPDRVGGLLHRSPRSRGA